MDYYSSHTRYIFSFLRVFQTLMLAIIFLFITSCQHTPLTEPSLTKEFAQSFFGSHHKFDISFSEGEFGKRYLFLPDFKKTDPEQYYFVEIQFSPYGTLISTNQYFTNLQSSKDRDGDAYKRWFPEIGSRAQRFITGAGPNGSTEKIIFSTLDKRYDISVTSGQKLPKSADFPLHSVTRIAKEINKYYKTLK